MATTVTSMLATDGAAIATFYFIYLFFFLWSIMRVSHPPQEGFEFECDLDT